MSDFIPISRPSITQREIDLVTDAVSSGWVSSLGPYIDRLEKQFAAFCGTQYAIATANGTVALHLALVACGIGVGDEVIVPDLTFAATANAVLYTGAKVVLADIEPNTLCIDPFAIERVITPRTKAIIPVHLYGHPADMSEIGRIAADHHLTVVEDAAEAHGAEAHGSRVGSLGRCGVFSFYGNKIMTTGEGGMITTDDHDLFERARRLRDHAMNPARRYWHDDVGYNYRMTNLQAAMGVAQMERINDLLEKRHLVFQWYADNLKDVPRISLNRTATWAKNVYWMVCAEIADCSEAERGEIMRRLKERGIDSRPYFYPLSDMPIYPPCNSPIAHSVTQRGLNLPSYFDLSYSDVVRICEALKSLV